MAKGKKIKSSVPLKKDGTPDLRYKVNKDNSTKRKPTTYNKLLKQFTKINDNLPEERKLSLKERRRIIKETLLPKWKEIPAYKQRIKEIKNDIFSELDKIPPKEICDINYIDDSDFAFVEWYALDETISELVPDCVYVKVTAGEFGETKIFNTRNYDYNQRGVRDIVEEIRPYAENESGKFVFSGIKKLRPRKPNDGTPENYYLDFVLFLIDNQGNETPQGNTDSVQFTLPKTRETRKKKTKVKHVIEAKIKALKSKKDSRKRARKTLENNIKKLKELSKQSIKKPTKGNVIAANKQFTKTDALLEKYFKTGKLTKEQYERRMGNIADAYFTDGEKEKESAPKKQAKKNTPKKKK